MAAPANGEPDRDLVRRAQAGEREALDQLVSRHGRLVLSVALGVIRHREDAEDVAQDVFVRFWRSVHRLDPGRPVAPWLIRLTLNAARSALARSPRRREDALGATDPAADPDPDRRLQESQFRESLDLALTTLSEREREVFLLRDIEELAVTDIAEVFGVTEVTIRRQSGDARRKVLDWLRHHRPELLRPDRPRG